MLQRMKRALVALACVLVSATVFGQGVVNFANFGGNPIRYDPIGFPSKTNAPLEVGSFCVALYWGVLGSSEDQLVQLGANGNVSPAFPIAGFFSVGGRTTGNATPRASWATFQVKAWSKGFASYEAAIASGDPTKFAGKSSVFDNYTGGGQIVATLNMPGFTVVPIPEPGSLAIGILGAAAVLLFRRKKMF